MKNIIISFLLLPFLSAYNAYSQQNFSHDLGKVTQYEMSMTEYDKDKDAEALVIYDFGENYFRGDDNRGFLLYMKRTMKIKILKQAGVEYANFEIPYYMEDRDWESIDNIEATTYNFENGQLTKTALERKNIFEEKISNNIKVKKIALPAVREGSVIEFSYTISTPYYFNMRKWEFQRKIPVLHSQLKYRAVPYYEYTYILKGASKLDEFKSEVKLNEIRFGQLLYKEIEYVFGMKNLIAFKDEEYITSEQDYLINLNFQISKIHFPRGGTREVMTTWPAMCDDLLKNDDFGKYIKSSEKEAKKIITSLDLTNKPIIDQVDIIAQYVKSQYNWNGKYSKFATISLSDFMKQKTGNTANLNLFLTGLLKTAGIETYPVVLSTRENGAISKSHPFQQFFNYVIAMVKVDDKYYFIDATESLLYFTDLPERCLNVEGLVIKPKSEEWAIIRQRSMSIEQKDLKLKIIPESNKIEVDAQFIGIGLSAYNFRSVYLDKKDNIIKYLKDKNNIDAKGEVNVIETEKLNKPFVFSFSFDTSIENSSNKLFIHPFCNLSISDNPFKQTNRTLLVDLVYIRGNMYKSVIEIPLGYKVEYVPKSFHRNDQLIEINYNINHDESKIVVNASYTLKKSTYDAKDYLSLKMSFAEMIKSFSEMVVLVKQ